MSNQMMQTITMENEQYVLVPASRYDRMIAQLEGTKDINFPDIPKKNSQGNRPAKQTMLALMARKLIRRRAAAGWTQSELARRAGVRPETISRIEGAKYRAQRPTIIKIDEALKAGGA